jgi:hypothetical protein
VHHVAATSVARYLGTWNWQFANNLADFASLGGASQRANYIDLDAGNAGDLARRYTSSIPRIQSLFSTDHDLTDYFRYGGDLLSLLLSYRNTGFLQSFVLAKK